MLQVLNSEENLNAKKVRSLPVKGSHKTANSTGEDRNKPTHHDLNKSLSGSKLPESEVAGMEQSGTHPKRHKTEKRKGNHFEGGQKKQTFKKKKVEEVEKKPTEYVYMF